MTRRIRSFRLADIQALLTDQSMQIEYHGTGKKYPRCYCLIKYGPPIKANAKKWIVTSWVAILHPVTDEPVDRVSAMSKEEWLKALSKAVQTLRQKNDD